MQKRLSQMKKEPTRVSKKKRIPTEVNPQRNPQLFFSTLVLSANVNKYGKWLHGNYQQLFNMKPFSNIHYCFFFFLLHSDKQ